MQTILQSCCSNSYSPPSWATFIAGLFVFITLILSVYLLFQHLSAYKNPEEQKFLIGVILMVPCYAVESFFSLMNPSISVDIEILRDCYESFAMYCFGRYLVACLGIFIALFYDLGLFRSPIAQALQLQSSIQDFIICIEMGVASVVHLYVFPAKPYALMGEFFSGGVAVLGDYVSADCPVDPDEVRDSERPTKVRIPQPEVDVRNGMTIKESVKDIFIGGGEYIVNDVKFTVTQAVGPMEKGISKFNEKLHKISQNIKKHDEEKKTKDDSCIASPPSRKVIRGIDDPLLSGSMSDTATVRKKKHRKKSGYTSAESSGE